MRHFLIPILLLLSGTAHAAIATDGAPMDSSFHSCNVETCGTNTILQFHLENHSLEGNRVYGETFFAAEGRSNFVRTMFAPARISVVYKPSTGEIYQESKDYIPTKDGIQLTPNSNIQRAPAGFSDQLSEFEKANYGVRITTEFQNFQYAINYDKQAVFTPKIYGDLGSLSESLGQNAINITFFGDSITLGANATSIYTSPHQPGYVGLVMAYLSSRYPNMIQFRNNSVGGWNSKNALKAVDDRVVDKKSDLIVLAFGINDEGYSPEKYKKNMEALIEKIRDVNSTVPILIVSPTRSNPDIIVKKKRDIHGPLIALKALTHEYHSIALADVTSVWDFMLTNKFYLDITGNGLNHPNDFSHRIIAEVVLKAILGDR
jgi:lysophospholipase L1-like esterase